MTKISAIIPTIGRTESLARLFESLISQTLRPDEVIVADGSSNEDIERLIQESPWAERGLKIKWLKIFPPNAVRQRQAAIEASSGDLLLLLDDDVELETECVFRMAEVLKQDSNIVAVTADFNNQSWSHPTGAWKLVLRVLYGMQQGEWQGRVIGPLLRFGYNPSPDSTVSMEWLGSGNSLIRGNAYSQVGGFSAFFLHRCTMNEDVDLSLKLRRVGDIVLCPHARMAHWHAPEGRVSAAVAAEDDLYNRYMIMRYTLVYSKLRSFAQVLLYFAVESGGNLFGALRRNAFDSLALLFVGRSRAIRRILFSDHNAE